MNNHQLHKRGFRHPWFLAHNFFGMNLREMLSSYSIQTMETYFGENCMKISRPYHEK